jgi:hypothetical protein
VADYTLVLGSYGMAEAHINAPVSETPNAAQLDGRREFTEDNGAGGSTPIVYATTVHPRCMLDEETVCPAHVAETGGTHETICGHFLYGSGPCVENPIRAEHFPPAAFVERAQNFLSRQREIADGSPVEMPSFPYATLGNVNGATWVTGTIIEAAGKKLTLRVDDATQDPRAMPDGGGCVWVGDLLRFGDHGCMKGQAEAKVERVDLRRLSAPIVVGDDYDVWVNVAVDAAAWKSDLESANEPTAYISKAHRLHDAWSEARQTGKTPFFCVQRTMTWEAAEFPENGIFELLDYYDDPCRILYPAHVGEVGKAMAATFGVLGIRTGESEWTDVLTATGARWARLSCADNISTKVYLGTTGAQGQTGLPDLTAGYDQIRIVFYCRTLSPYDTLVIYNYFLGLYTAMLDAEIAAVEAAHALGWPESFSIPGVVTFTDTYESAVELHTTYDVDGEPWWTIRNSFMRGLVTINSLKSADWSNNEPYDAAIAQWKLDLAALGTDVNTAVEEGEADANDGAGDPVEGNLNYAMARAWANRINACVDLISFWETFPSRFGTGDIFEQLRLSYDLMQSTLGTAGVSPCADSCAHCRPLPDTMLLADLPGVDNENRWFCDRRNSVDPATLAYFNPQCWLMGKCDHYEPGPVEPVITPRHFAELWGGGGYFINRKSTASSEAWNWYVESGRTPSLTYLTNSFDLVNTSARLPHDAPTAEYLDQNPFIWFDLETGIETDVDGNESLQLFEGGVWKIGGEAYDMPLADFVAGDHRGLFPRVCDLSAYSQLTDGEVFTHASKPEYYRGLQSIPEILMNPTFGGPPIVWGSGRENGLQRFNKGARRVYFPALSKALVDQWQYQSAPRTDGPRARVLSEPVVIDEVEYTLEFQFIADGPDFLTEVSGVIWAVTDNEDGTVTIDVDLGEQVVDWVYLNEDKTATVLASGNFVSLPDIYRIKSHYGNASITSAYDKTIEGDTVRIGHDDLTDELYYVESSSPSSGYDRTAELGPLTYYRNYPAEWSHLRKCDVVRLVDEGGPLAALGTAGLRGKSITRTRQGVIHPSASIAAKHAEKGLNPWTSVDAEDVLTRRARGRVLVAKTVVDTLPADFCFLFEIGAPGLANRAQEFPGELIRSTGTCLAALDAVRLSNLTKLPFPVAVSATCGLGISGLWQMWRNNEYYRTTFGWTYPDWYAPTTGAPTHGLNCFDIDYGGGIDPDYLLKATPSPTGKFGNTTITGEGFCHPLSYFFPLSGAASIGCHSGATGTDLDMMFRGVWAKQNLYQVDYEGVLGRIDDGATIEAFVIKVKLPDGSAYYQGTDRFYYALGSYIGDEDGYYGSVWSIYDDPWNPDTEEPWVNHEYTITEGEIPEAQAILFGRDQDDEAWSQIGAVSLGLLTDKWRVINVPALGQMLLEARGKYRQAAILIAAGGPLSEDPNYYAGDKALLSTVMDAYETVTVLGDTIGPEVCAQVGDPGNFAVRNPSSAYDAAMSLVPPDYEAASNALRYVGGFPELGAMHYIHFERTWRAYVGGHPQVDPVAIKYRLPDSAVTTWSVQGLYPNMI